MAYQPAGEDRAPDHQIVIPSLLERLTEVEEATETISKQYALEEDDRDNLAIAVTETVNNAIIHGNKLDPDKRVIISFYFEPDRVHVYIRDHGPGFDPGMIGNPLDPQNILKETGRGIFILRSIMDDVEFFHLTDGTEVKITKRIKSAE